METIKHLYYNPSMWIILPVRFIKRFRNKVGVVATFSVLFLYSVNFFIISNAMNSNYERPFEPGELPFAVVHLDLKGAPPTLTYLKSILPKLKELGATGLLIDYEDMFPYSDWLKNLSTPYHYSPNELKKFLTEAHGSGFEVIPLVQSFGHMEFVLKLDEFARFRENPLYPDSLCPSNELGFDVVREMLRQVINFHKNIVPLEHIHVGCDEVFHMNHCQLCKKRKLDKTRLYLSHIKKIAETVRLLSPTTTVLIWDDMLRTIKPSFWKHIRYFNNVEPVWWNYASGVTINHSILRFYHQKFNNIWIASAFKGSDGREAALPNITERFLNHLSWINIIRDYRFGGENDTFRFKGFILTGWSRYSHFDPLCELLPMSLPSLFLNLILIQKFPTVFTIKREEYSSNEVTNFYNYVKDDFYNVLKCDQINRTGMDDFNKCYNIKVFAIYNTVKIYLDYIEEVHKKIGLRDISLFAKFDYLNFNYLAYEKTICKKLYETLKNYEANAKGKLRLAFDENVYKEFIGYKSYRAKNMLTKCIKDEVLKYQTWPRGRNIEVILQH